ncbi:fructose-bisphosphatase class III [Rubritalea marina]|uniref:fructose-bisphosphatase class III n=1 Tax=Rubritalea marina TaxID=361055 RepID=UPI00146155B1|nr:fructose-bisphosphatase class III [Rubritalea marina]
MVLKILSKTYRSSESAVFEIAALKAQLELPKGVTHVISDVHGEARKLRHVINNASGRLRPKVAELFDGDTNSPGFKEFLHLLYYPTELLQMKEEEFRDNSEGRYQWVLQTLQRQFDIIRWEIHSKRRKDIKYYTPKQFRELFEILLNYPAGGHHEAFLFATIRELVNRKMEYEALRAASRFIRNLSVEELVVAGDLGDRGSRIDWVIDYLMHQPNVSIVWGNHDVSWMGACLGHPALIAIVLRVSLRYRRMFQLEEGYGILTKPLEMLAESVYADDPADCFLPKRGGERDERVIARMQKAIAIIQFKLEGQLVERHREWEMDDRNILHNLDLEAGTVTIKGKQYPLRDSHLPTVDPSDPNKLSPEEEHCLQRLIESFVSSARLWEHMKWVTERGSMAEVRDKAVIFHACLALDEDGAYQSLNIDGKDLRGPEQFGALNRVIKRAFKKGTAADQSDVDWLYYLWAGPKSPLFGKDKMATFESYFIEDKEAKKEHRNPWFEFLHDHSFCERVCRDMGVQDGGLIVNGHVPVKVEKGEDPVKRGGNAVTIDGAFSEAYGDRGFTLILSPQGEYLAEHHGFKDPVSVVRTGEDIIPTMRKIRTYDSLRLVKDTDRGSQIRQQIHALESLVEAYQNGEINEEE